MQGSVCPELQFNSLKSGDQRQSMTSRCQIPKLVDTRSMFDAQATKGFLGGVAEPMLLYINRK